MIKVQFTIFYKKRRYGAYINIVNNIKLIFSCSRNVGDHSENWHEQRDVSCRPPTRTLSSVGVPAGFRQEKLGMLDQVQDTTGDMLQSHS